MKGTLVAFVGVFCIASLIASSVSAKGKPPKPGGTDTEFIAFEIETEGEVSDLLGGQEVEGCCPNAGPFPEYKLTLVRDLGEGEVLIHAGSYDGYLFINRYRTGKNREYVVQFWVLPEDSEYPFQIEIIGGVIDDDKKNKITTVTFVDEECVDLVTGEYIDTVSFTLVRTRL